MNIDDGLVGRAEAMRLTGLTRHEIEYFERLGYLPDLKHEGGPPTLNGGRNRRFSPHHIEILRRYKQLKESDISIDVAGPLAADGVPGIEPISLERLQALTDAHALKLQSQLNAQSILQALLMKRLQAERAR